MAKADSGCPYDWPRSSPPRLPGRGEALLDQEMSEKRARLEWAREELDRARGFLQLSNEEANLVELKLLLSAGLRRSARDLLRCSARNSFRRVSRVSRT